MVVLEIQQVSSGYMFYINNYGYNNINNSNTKFIVQQALVVRYTKGGAVESDLDTLSFGITYCSCSY